MAMKVGIVISTATVEKTRSPVPTQAKAATLAGRSAETGNREDVPLLLPG